MRLVWFQVEGYKNLQRRILIENLGALNVIHGDNNVGKSNLLEAIGVFFEALGMFQPTEADGLLPGEVGRPHMSGALQWQQWPQQFGFLTIPPYVTTPAIYLSRDLAPQQRLLGQPVRDFFHIHTRKPIRLAAQIDVSAEQARRASPADEMIAIVGSHEIEIELNMTGDNAATLHLRRWSHDNVALIPQAPGKATNIPKTLLAQMARNYTFVPVGRDVIGSSPDQDADLDPYSYRDLIPAELCLRLYDAQQASEATQHQPWERFEKAMESFAAILDGERLAAEYDRHNQRVRLVVFQKGSRRIPSYMLGSGVQQIITLIGTLATSSASLALIEEPELNLRYTLQMRLRDAFLSLTQPSPSDSGRQFVLTTHSVGFENDMSGGNAFFYGLTKDPEGAKLDRRPVGEAAVFTDNQPFERPQAGKNPPASWVNNEGLVQVPQRILDRMQIPHGGGVFFVKRKDTGHVELLTSAQFFDIVESEEPDGDT